MTTALCLEPVELRRMGYLFLPEVVRAIVPQGCVGVYLLLGRGCHPVYVGRSDTCVRHRLANHEHLGNAAYFTWEPRLTPGDAFYMEAWWFHRLADYPTALNRRHPGPPAGSATPCPFCRQADLPALRLALPSGLPVPAIDLPTITNHQEAA